MKGMIKMDQKDLKIVLPELMSMTFMDDFLYSFLLSDEKCVHEILRILLKRDDFIILSIHTEQYVHNPHGKSVVFDAYIKIKIDGMIVHIDLEIQKDIRKAPPNRLQYYRSMLDSFVSNEGMDYGKMEMNLSIWIMNDDYFRNGNPSTFIQDYMKKDGRSLKNAHSVGILVINGKYVGDGEIAILVHDLNCTDPEDMINPVLKEKMYYLKRTEEGGIVMTERLQEFIKEKERLAVEKERRRIVTYLLQKGETLDDALDLIGVPSKD